MSEQAVRRFVSGHIVGDISITPIFGGANNRGYKVSQGRKKFFVKAFPDQGPVSLAKLENEFNFSCFLYERGVRQLPRPLAKCSHTLMALYEFVDGEPVTLCRKFDVTEALKFISAINHPDLLADSALLPLASDCPSSLSGFAELVDKRLTRFTDFTPGCEVDEQCLDYVAELDAYYRQCVSEMRNNAGEAWERTLEADVISPSDFGFHNAINTKQGIVFLDFEYAGRDSCWKMVADFFCQPKVPVSLGYITHFFRDPKFSFLANRPKQFLIAFKLSQIKWCLIMLNEFLSESQFRRVFSSSGFSDTNIEQHLVQKKVEQLEKSQLYFKKIESRTSLLESIIQGSNKHESCSAI